MRLLIGLALLGLATLGLGVVVVIVAALWVAHPLIVLSLAGLAALWRVCR